MSEILDIAQEMARDRRKVGAIDDVTLREVEGLCMPRPRRMTPAEIRRIRTDNCASQATFAAFLGAGETTIQQWELGEKNRPDRRSVYSI